MEVYKWSKNSLISMGKQGYKVIACDDEAEALKVKAALKEDKRCAQAGYVINREGKTIYFVLTKSRKQEPLGRTYNVGGIEKKVYNVGG